MQTQVMKYMSSLKRRHIPNSNCLVCNLPFMSRKEWWLPAPLPCHLEREAVSGPESRRLLGIRWDKDGTRIHSIPGVEVEPGALPFPLVALTFSGPAGIREPQPTHQRQSLNHFLALSLRFCKACLFEQPPCQRREVELMTACVPALSRHLFHIGHNFGQIQGILR